jgi:hypothetical protein
LNQPYLDYQTHKQREAHYPSSNASHRTSIYYILIINFGSILALGSNEYFDLSYIDPLTQQTVQCSEDCTLSNATYEDFTVLSTKSVNGIRININSWYGSGGGLGYVQIFQSGN